MKENIHMKAQSSIPPTTTRPRQAVTLKLQKQQWEATCDEHEVLQQRQKEQTDYMTH